jgi:hypothetical protein
MSRVLPLCLDADCQDRSSRADVLLRDEPEDEEEEEEDDHKEEDDMMTTKATATRSECVLNSITPCCLPRRKSNRDV